MQIGRFRVFDWLDIRERFGDTIILGNGSSIAINSIYSYDSILARAKELEYVKLEEEKVFREYGTSNFERVLNGLQHAQRVVGASMVGDSGKVEKYIRRRLNNIKTALRRTVFDLHGERKDILPHFSAIAEFLGGFHRVFSLNYDLIIYWSLLAGTNMPKNMHEVSMTDCFFEDDDNAIDDNLNLLFDKNAALNLSLSNKTYVFYPHGNFALAKEKTDQGIGREVKISCYGKRRLLSTIAKYWMSGKFNPLIVSEGNRYQKEDIISQSRYLRSVLYDILPRNGGTIVFYGFGFSENDLHIVENAFARGNSINEVAVSVFAEGMDNNMIAAYCRDAESMIDGAYKNAGGRSNLDVTFFDSSSEGAWIHKNVPAQHEPEDKFPF